jgi:hypothetical protein
MVSKNILTYAWLFWPLFILFRRRLSDQFVNFESGPRPSIRFLLAWTALAA